MRRAILFSALLVALSELGCGAPSAPAAAHGPRRWVSLSPAMTEVLFAVGAGPEVAGVCAPATYPPEARDRRVVASFERLDLEGIVALKPDACFTTTGVQDGEALGTLRRLGCLVRVYDVPDLAHLTRCMRDAGAKTGHAETGEAAARGFEERVRRAAPPPGEPPVPAVVVVGLDPLVVAGRASFLADVLRAAGFSNALQSAGESYPVVSLESLAACHPRVVVFPGGEIPREEAGALLTRLNRLLAAPARRVEVPADLLVRPGPRTADAVEILARARGGGS